MGSGLNENQGFSIPHFMGKFLKMKIDIREVLFWILLVILVGLIFWYVFGNSPTEVAIYVTITSMIILKVWHISDRQIKSDINAWHSFNNIKKDLILIKGKLEI